MFRLSTMLITAALLAGCGPEIVRSTGASPEDGPLYCYKSLSDITCYSAAYDRDRRRLTGFVGIPPVEEDPLLPVKAPPPLGSGSRSDS
ncbi:MAG: hypothetical protein RIC36_10620 [Rhodospirillales bacterium]